MNDIQRIKSLIHESDSPAMIDEIQRRINAYNKLRIREMNYFISSINGLSDKAYRTFSNELDGLRSFGRNKRK